MAGAVSVVVAALLSYPTSPSMLGNINSFRELEWRGRYRTWRMGCSMS
jgi:hypothetical protein